MKKNNPKYYQKYTTKPFQKHNNSSYSPKQRLRRERRREEDEEKSLHRLLKGTLSPTALSEVTEMLTL